MIRITIDLDFKNKFKVAYYVSKAIILVSGISYLELRPSFSKGYHLIIWSRKNLSFKKQLELRKKLGDDVSRIYADRKRKIGRNTLFSYKKTLD